MNVCEKEAGRKIGVAVQALRKWLYRRKGPANIKIVRIFRYRIKDFLSIIKENRIDPKKGGLQ